MGTAAAAAKSLQSCLTLCDPRDGSPPGSPVPGILQARTLEWVAILGTAGPKNSNSRVCPVKLAIGLKGNETMSPNFTVRNHSVFLKRGKQSMLRHLS